MLQLIYFWVFMVFSFNAYLCFESDWHSFQSEFKDANREELVVTNITTDENFKLAYKVTKWTSLSFGPTCYSVGLMEKGLVILVSTLKDDRSNFDIESTVKDLDEKPLEVALMTNRKMGDTEIIMVLAFYEKLQLEWYKIHVNGSLDIIWTIPLQQYAIHVNVFQMRKKHVLLVASNMSTVDLYEFDLLKNNYWSIQHIPLPTSADSSIVNNFEYDYFLSIPQKSKNMLLIFKYEENHFIPYKNLTSSRLNSVTSFEIGFKTFLAIDGLNAGIYQFTRSGLVREEIIHSHLEGVSYWLPVPVTTYRDEVILFAQRIVDYSSHRAKVIDIITYNGGKFEEHEDIPCSYFGEYQTWLVCLSHGDGIIGSSYIAVDDKLALIVPAPMDVNLFFIHFTMKHLPNPLKNEIERSLELKESLQKMILDQNKEYEELEKLYKPPIKAGVSSVKKEYNNTLLGVSQRRDRERINEKLEEVEVKIAEIKEKAKKITEKEGRTEFNTITINGRLEINGDSNFGEVEIEKIKGSPVTELLEDVVRKDTLKPIAGAKTFSDLYVDKISFQKVNDVDADEIVFKDQVVELDGKVTFKEPVDIERVHVRTGKVNDIKLEDKIVDIQKKQGALEFEKVNVTGQFQAQKINNLNIHTNKVENTETGVDLDSTFDSFFIPQNVTVININGENFQEFVSSLCLLNIKCYFPGVVKINGNVKVNKGVYTEYLNDLKFPEEYILMDSVHHSNITGKKTFTNSLTARDIRSRGAINGLDTRQLITLSTKQDISGKITFKDIQVTEALNVTGAILGEHINKFLPNPTLEEVDHIKANVHFKDLEVDGDIIIDNYFNGNNLKHLLKDLIYKDDEDATITSVKDFPKDFTVQDNLHISSNSINNINIDSIVTKDTDQVLDISFLKGDVTFENLALNGTFDGINVTQMDQELVKLTGEQYISSTLIFNDELEINHFEITEKLNDLPPDDYIYADGDREIEHDIQFEEIEAKDILVEGDVVGNLAEIDFNDFNDRYLSFTKEQVIKVPYSIKHSTVDDLNVEYINDRAYNDLFESGTLSSTIKNLLEKDQLQIENLFVDGSINIETINGENMDDVLPKNILVDENGKPRRNMSIRGDVSTDTIDIVKLSGLSWRKYVEHLVFKDEDDPVLDSPKINFTKGIIVEKLVETDELNGVSLENVLIKEGNQEIASEVVIKGSVTFKDMEIAKDINGVNISTLLNSFSANDGAYIIKDDLLFSKLPHIYKLKTEDFVNNQNITDIFSNLVFRDEDCVLNGDTMFEDIVTIFGNMAVSERINEILLSNVVPRMVLTTKDMEISGPVIFMEPVSIKQHLIVEENMLTKTLHNCDLNEWITNAVFIDRGLMLGNFTLEKAFIREELNVDFVNDINMEMVIPLRSNQTIDYLEFEELRVLNDIPVGNLVNGYNLAEEFKRTVMANSDQHIPSNVVFQKAVLIRENLNVHHTINGENVSKIVTTNTDQNLTSVFNFTSKCRIKSDLHIHGMLNGIDANAWLHSGVKIDSPKVQKVYDDWFVAENITFDDDVRGVCKVGDLNLATVMKEVNEKRNYKYQMEYAIVDDYKNMCTDVTYLYKSAKEQIYKFKYFDDLETMKFEDQVQYVHHFKYNDDHYLLVNVGSFETGHISQVISVRGKEEFYLVTNGIHRDGCDVSGTNLWRFDVDNITLESTMDHQELLQESLVTGTFYTSGKEGVIEFKITSEGVLKKYRKWMIHEENVAFVPRGLKTGLALRTGSKIIHLDQTDPLVEDDFSGNTEAVIIGKFTQVSNSYLPGRHDGDLVVTNVGITSTRRNLLAVATHEETSVRGRLDFIKIYENPIKGELFHKVPSYKPSSLVSIEFGQGETLLVFLENEKTLQVYEYKGIEGFKHHSSSKIEGSKLFLMTLPVEPYLNERKVLGIVHENKIRTIQSVMVGNRIRNDLKCGL